MIVAQLLFTAETATAAAAAVLTCRENFAALPSPPPPTGPSVIRRSRAIGPTDGLQLYGNSLRGRATTTFWLRLQQLNIAPHSSLYVYFPV